MAITHDVFKHYLKGKEEHREREHLYVTDLSACPTSVWLQFNGQRKEVDDRTLRVFEMGNIMEDFLIDAYKQQGVLIDSQIPVRYDINDKKEFLHGRADALIRDENGDYLLLEIKTQHSNAFHWRKKEATLQGKNLIAKDHHIEQVCLYYNKLKDEYPGLKMAVVYISKDDMCIDQVPVDPEIADDVVARALNKAAILETAISGGIKPPPIPSLVEEETLYYNKKIMKWKVNWKAKYCDLHHICTQDEKWLEKAEKEARARNK